MQVKSRTTGIRRRHAAALCAGAWVVASSAGCNMLPRDDLRVFAQELRPPEEAEVDESVVVQRIRDRTGVEQFEPEEEFLTDPPPVPPWAMTFMQVLVDDD